MESQKCVIQNFDSGTQWAELLTRTAKQEMCAKNIRSESEWVGHVTRTGKQEVCDTEFRFENASEILEVCEVVK